MPGECYRIDLDGSVDELYGGIEVTNGIGFSPDGRTLYHVDSTSKGIWAHDVAADGSVSNRRHIGRAAFERGIPDGMCVDADGNLWVAHVGGRRVVKLSPTGERDRRDPGAGEGRDQRRLRWARLVGPVHRHRRQPRRPAGRLRLPLPARRRRPADPARPGLTAIVPSVVARLTFVWAIGDQRLDAVAQRVVERPERHRHGGADAVVAQLSPAQIERNSSSRAFQRSGDLSAIAPGSWRSSGRTRSIAAMSS